MASLYVGNLDCNCTEAMLFNLFGSCGKLLNIRIARDKRTHNCLGFAFVDFSSKVEAETALTSLNYSLVFGKPIRLMWSYKDVKRLPENANVFIKNLDCSVDEKALHVTFASYGEILSLKVEKDENGRSKGYAFIQYADEKGAEEAVRSVHQKMLHGKTVFVAKFVPQSKRLDENFQNVYINNFDSDFSEENLVDMCSRFGEIRSAKLMRNEDGTSKGFGFVSFVNSEDAREAVAEINGKYVNGRKLFAGRAKKKSERKREVLEEMKRKLNERCQRRFGMMETSF